MIHYHGGPISPQAAAIALWTRRHGLCSFAEPYQTPLMAEICQSFVLDNGAFSLWKSGGRVDVDAYCAWVRQWETHPGFDFAIVPDTIDGTEEDNARMSSRWLMQMPRMRPGAIVWHLHESLDRLATLIRCVQVGIYSRLCLGSSGDYSDPGTPAWWKRMNEARPVICDSDGRPLVKMHGLRMLNPTIFSHIPLASADSCNVALNIKLDKRWTGAYAPVTPATRALVLAERIELHAAASTWSEFAGVAANPTLVG